MRDGGTIILFLVDQKPLPWFQAPERCRRAVSGDSGKNGLAQNLVSRIPRHFLPRRID